MKYGLIKKGVCVSETETDNEKEAQRRAEVHGCVAVPLMDGFGVGSKYTGTKWKEPVTQEESVVKKELTVEGVAKRIGELQGEVDRLKEQILKEGVVGVDGENYKPTSGI